LLSNTKLLGKKTFNHETLLSNSDMEVSEWLCQINRKKRLTGLYQTVSCLLNHNGSVKVNFLHTIYVTVAEYAGRN